MALRAIELTFLDHMHQFNSCEQDPNAAKRFESKHRSHDPLDRPVVLLDDVVHVLALPQFDIRPRVGIDAQDGGRVRAALIDGDLLGYTVQADGLFDKTSGGCVISLCAKQKVDRIAVAIDRSVQILPLASEPDVRFVHPPARADGAFAPSERGYQHRRDLDRPAMDGGVINDNAALGHHFLNVPQAQRIGRVPANTREHHLQRVVHPLDHLTQSLDQVFVRS